MLKDVAGIRFQGANFETLTDILFFNPHEANSKKIKKVKKKPEIEHLLKKICRV